MAVQLANFTAVLTGCVYQLFSRLIGTPCSGTSLSEIHCIINYGIYFFLFSKSFSKKISTDDPNESGYFCADLPLATVRTLLLAHTHAHR